MENMSKSAYAFQGAGKKRQYFEGWYLKHQTGGRTIAIIPAFHLDKAGHPSVSLQIIWDGGSHCINYRRDEFIALEDRFYEKIGSNVFSERGILVDIASEGLVIKGSLRYGPLRPLESDAMGPFRYVPLMQCRHGVMSMTHRVSGLLKINGEKILFNGAVGYIEKDWGCSFPKSYLWTQSCWRERGGCSIMLSIADVPFLASSISGCICAVFYGGSEYRLATYRGVKILRYSESEVILRQGKYLLEVSMPEKRAYRLNAPNQGSMTRTIHESPSCTVRYRFYIGGRLMFDKSCENASLEYVSDAVVPCPAAVGE